MCVVNSVLTALQLRIDRPEWTTSVFILESRLRRITVIKVH